MPRANELSIDGLEITQTIQEMGHSVPLVADKPTVARAYLSIKGTAPVSIRGVLQGRRSGGAWTNLSSLNVVTVDPSVNGQLRPKREDINRSLNFRLPASWISAGTLDLRLATVTESATGSPRTCSDCLTSPVSVTMRASAPMRLRIIGLRYTAGTPPITHVPRALDLTLIDSWLRRAYPISTLTSSSTTIGATNTWPFSYNQANAQLATIRANDVAGGTDRRTHYYGLVFDGGGFMRGCASAIPTGGPDPTALASGPTGPSSGWDTDGSYGDWYTGHELGHTYGRLHPGSGCGKSSDDPNEPFPNGQISGADGAFVGLDVGDPARSIPLATLPGVTWKDVMTSCNNQWVSHYTYTALRDRLTGENSLPAGAPMPSGDMPLGAAGSIPSTLRVGVDALAVVGMDPSTNLATRKAAPPLRTGATGRPRIVTGSRETAEIVTGGSSSEGPMGADASMSAPDPTPAPAYETPPPVQRGLVIPSVPPGAMRSLRREAEPDVRLATSIFTWEASDDDSDQLTYTVLASTDRGKTWQTIAVGLTEPKLEINPEDFGKVSKILLRVIANDGVNTTMITGSQPFNL